MPLIDANVVSLTDATADSFLNSITPSINHEKEVYQGNERTFQSKNGSTRYDSTSRRGEKKEKVINSKRKTFALYSIQAFNFLSMWSRIDDDTWRFMEKFS